MIIMRVHPSIILGSVGCVLLLLPSCNRTSTPPLEEIFIDQTEEGISVKTMNAILKTQTELSNKPEDPKIAIALAYQYLQALRENADTEFYDRVEGLMQHVLSEDGDNPEVTFLRGNIAAGKHDFKAAEQYARILVTSQPDVARYHGLLADALTETGQYEEAIETLQAMADIRPDYAAFTRIAYVREIFGDTTGAREAMEKALEAHTGIPENIAWAYAEYARLWLASDPVEAKKLYERALEVYPDYPAALAGLATVAMTEGDSEQAKMLMERVMKILPLPEHAALLGDIYLYEKNEQKAAAQFALVRAGYQQIAARGTNVELERIQFLLDHDLDLDTIVDRARAVYANQPTIYAADTLAWALFKTKQYEEAQTYIEKALITGSQDPIILFHAGMIAKTNGKKEKARELFDTVLEQSPHFSFVWRPVTERERKLLEE